MSKIAADHVIPGIPTHPGILIKEEIKARNTGQKDLARAMNISVTALSDLIHGRRNITAEIALKLERSLDIPAIFWMDFQAQYEIDRLRRAESAC